MRSRRLLMSVVVASAFLLAGCTPGPVDPPAPSREQQLDALLADPVEPEWTAPLASLGGEAVRADGVVLVLARGGGETGAALQALDAESGEKLWSAPVTSGATPADSLWSPAVARTADGTAVTLVVGTAARQPDGNWAHHLEVRRVATGEVLASPPDTWVSNVQTCAEHICLHVWSPDGIWREAELDADAGAIEPGDEIVPGSVDTWQLTDNLHLSPADDYLAWEVDGEETWRTTLAEHLPDGVGPGVFGGDFQLALTVDDQTAPSIMAIDFTTTTDPVSSGTFAFSTGDGRALWSSTDISLCRTGEPVACTAGATAQTEGGSAPAAPQTYSGLDLATGESTWSTTFDAVTLPTSSEGTPSAATPGFLPVVDGGQTLFLDSATGEVLPAPEDAGFACFSDTTWPGLEDARTSGETVQHTSGQLAASCDAKGIIGEKPLTRAAVLASSASAWRGDELVDSSISLGQPIEDPLDDEAAWYYVTTTEGVCAYRF